jgi:hypothetical protein
MAKDTEKDVLIADHGIITSNKRLHVSIFVFICRVMTVILAVLGALAFYEGNFR